MKIILFYQLFVNIFKIKIKGKKKHEKFYQIKAISLIRIVMHTQNQITRIIDTSYH